MLLIEDEISRVLVFLLSMGQCIEIFGIEGTTLLLRGPYRQKLSRVGSECGILGCTRAHFGILGIRNTILVPSPRGGNKLVVTVNLYLKYPGSLKKVSGVAPEATFDCLNHVDAIKGASKVITGISALNDPRDLALFASLKKPIIIGLAAHVLMLAPLELAIVGNTHHLREGISGKHKIIRGFLFTLSELVYISRADAAFPLVVALASISAKAVQNPQSHYFRGTIGVINRYTLCISGCISCKRERGV